MSKKPTEADRDPQVFIPVKAGKLQWDEVQHQGDRPHPWADPIPGSVEAWLERQSLDWGEDPADLIDRLRRELEDSLGKMKIPTTGQWVTRTLSERARLAYALKGVRKPKNGQISQRAEYDVGRYKVPLLTQRVDGSNTQFEAPILLLGGAAWLYQAELGEPAVSEQVERLEDDIVAPVLVENRALSGFRLEGLRIDGETNPNEFQTPQERLEAIQAAARTVFRETIEPLINIELIEVSRVRLSTYEEAQYRRGWEGDLTVDFRQIFPSLSENSWPIPSEAKAFYEALGSLIENKLRSISKDEEGARALLEKARACLEAHIQEGKVHELEQRDRRRMDAKRNSIWMRTGEHGLVHVQRSNRDAVVLERLEGVSIGYGATGREWKLGRDTVTMQTSLQLNPAGSEMVHRHANPHPNSPIEYQSKHPFFILKNK